jgi:Asp-tRNA(Asn)/Glu-tRNA(Gln) amidotransferase A subunit family amidase
LERIHQAQQIELAKENRSDLNSTGDPAFCTLWTLTGLPALSLPLLAGENGLPLGVQLVGPPGRDGRLLRTATALVEMLREPSKGKRRLNVAGRAAIRSTNA